MHLATKNSAAGSGKQLALVPVRRTVNSGFSYPANGIFWKTESQTRTGEIVWMNFAETPPLLDEKQGATRMICFREERWLRANGATRFTAYIGPGARTRDEVMWMLDLRYIAAGVRWRRVRGGDRPWLTMEVSSFAAPRTSWVGLEQANFWNVHAREDDWAPRPRRGYCYAHYYRRAGAPNTQEEIPIADCNWRVVSRDGRWFTVELAAVSGRHVRLADLLTEQPTLVTANGEEEQAPLSPAEFWKKNADIYMLESVPFGTVTVRTPRNARDPSAMLSLAHRN